MLRRPHSKFLHAARWIAIALLVHWILVRVVPPESPGDRAGFARGMLHGALMPLAMPSLATGHDVPIYSENNTGRTYKLGYTVGVNACGALFFGAVFWRFRSVPARSPSPSPGPHPTTGEATTS